MTLRRRLALFIFLMMGLLALLGGLLLFGGPAVIASYRRSMESMNALNAIRELRANVTRQRISLNRYLLLDEPEELLTFDEAGRAIQSNLHALESSAMRNRPWFAEIRSLALDTERSANGVRQIYARGDKIKAHEMAAGLYDKFLERVTVLERDSSAEAVALYDHVQLLTRQMELAVVLTLGLAFIIGIVLFRSLYRAVMTPLETLRVGAEEFGRGQWDHRIELAGENEFGALADSFNTMAANVKQLKMQAVHLDRMSAVGQLAGGVAHEINNPLTAVLGQAQILMARLKPEDPAYPHITKIEQAALRCKKIVRGLLDFSRPGQAAFESVDVNAIMSSALELCEADLKRGRINVVDRSSGGRPLPSLVGNSSELQQVFLNLITNAIHAMPRGGTLTIDSKAHTEPMVVDDRKKGAKRQVPGPWVEISVKDTGVGIAKEHLDRVFEPFFTTKEIGKGTGLGLAVSVGIVQKHGGDIRVESLGLNRGATFTVLMPVNRNGAE